VGIAGREVPDQRLVAVQIQCLDFSAVRLGNVGGALVGDTGGSVGVGFARRCAQHKSLTGFEARSSDARWVTGLQPVCTRAATDHTRYVGGGTGGARSLSCPAGQLVVGTVQRASSSTIDHFGLLCAPRARVRSGDPLTADSLWVLHSSFNDGRTNNFYPSQQVAYNTYLTTTAAGVTERRCPTGRALTGMHVRAGALVDRIESLICTDYTPRGLRGGNVSVPVEVGGTGGGMQVLYCPEGEVGGHFTRSGWLLDGLALRCL
jgi:hypothetical protein